MLPDVPAIDKVFDYRIPDGFGPLPVGTIVRVPLHGRRVGGWVVGHPDRPDTDRPLQSVAKVTGMGPPADVVDLAGWAAWRWAGRTATFLRTASPPAAVRGLPRSGAARTATAEPNDVVDAAFAHRGPVVVRLPPAADPFPFVQRAAAGGDALVLAPSLSRAARLAQRLSQAGGSVALLPREWARAAAGGNVAIGARAAAWAPRPQLTAVVVIDEHDEVWQEERAPTWHARDVVVERARRAGVPCVLLSPCPTLDALAIGPLVTESRGEDRAGWPMTEVVDRRREPPGLGLYSSRLVDVVRDADRVVCVLNRKGRARLLACAACGELARCDVCGGAVEQASGQQADGTQDDAGLRCRRCGVRRPALCLSCGSTKMKSLRLGVTRVREDLERLAGRPVGEVTGDTTEPVADVPVVVGTEAVLHRVARADVVAFLDFDQELLAPRYRAAEQALALLARAARVVGPRDRGGRLLVQTRLPTHDAIDAAVHADPARLSVVEAAQRAALRFPPETALAAVSGEAGDAFVAGLGDTAGVEVLGPSDGRWLLRAATHAILCDALAAVPRPPGRLRVEVDPLRV